MKVRLAFSVLAFLLTNHPMIAGAQWQPNGAPVCTADQEQYQPQLISDGAGGAIMTWYDYRNAGSVADIYAQRVDAYGNPLWAADGVAVCTAADIQYQPMLATDGMGGAFIAWTDLRSGGDYDVYAQRLDASGNPLWAANGVPVAVVANLQLEPAVVPVKSGGAIVVWRDTRAGNYDIYAQQLDLAGAPQWAANGVALCAHIANQYGVRVVDDGADGAIVCWYDDRAGLFDIYAQRVDAGGTTLWAADGVGLCTAANDQYYPSITADGSGGAIAAWQDLRGADLDIYSQRVDDNGSLLWGTNGRSVCTEINNQSIPIVVSDGSGGVIITWQDYRSGVGYDIYAQRMSATGSGQWAFDGLALCTAANDQTTPKIASDGDGGAIVTWEDFRIVSNRDIYAQRIDQWGTVYWTTDGAPVSLAANQQYDPEVVSDAAGNAIMTWRDGRSTADDVYAQRVEVTYGYWGHPEPTVASANDIPNDQGGRVAVNWQASGRDRPVPPTIGFYSIWRATELAALVTGDDASLSALEEVDVNTPAGVRMTLPASPYYWELVGTQNAYRWPNYSFSADTRADSTSGDPGVEYFMVAAHQEYYEPIAFASNVMAGYSVDNIAPAAPLMLTAQRFGPDVHLFWNAVSDFDLRDYAVYRATSSGVTPEPIYYLTSAPDTMLVDTNALGTLYYIVTAFDVHDNESDPSNEASVSGATGVDPPSIGALTVLPNHPNPFTGSTEFQIGVPTVSDVRVEVYDVTGRRVSVIEVPQAGAGWQQIPFAGRDSNGRRLASGVYFYRVTAGAETITRKMVIAR